MKKRNVRRLTVFLLVMALLWTNMSFVVGATQNISEDVDGRPQLDCKSALLMEASTGKVLFEQNADEALHPASVTKIMTLLLVMEAIESGKIRYEDTVTASAHASSMGGSQIFLKEGEQMTVEDMIKSVVIASANDAAVALAEHISGTEEAFVEQMNRRASELGMTSTHFENTNGLDDTTTAHLTSARDIALMSRELLKHKKITEYSSTWMDTVRDGAFGLTNTNRLVRFYKGATGLKTGSTAKAGFCISATAKRDGMELICVIMGAESRDIRNAAATSLLDWGFANYALYTAPKVELSPIKVLGGMTSTCAVTAADFFDVVHKSDAGRVEYIVEIPESIGAPIQKGDIVGKIIYRLNGEILGEIPVTAEESIEKIGFWGLFLRLLSRVSAF